MMKNPVMFVVEIGSVLTTVLLFVESLRHHGHFSFDLQITLWLWFTVLFANFAEAMAEGRGKAQADALRQAKSETTAYRMRAVDGVEEIPSSQLRVGRYGARRCRPDDPRRRRSDRRRGFGRRIGHHRRVRAGDSRSRRRPLCGHGRHARAFRCDHGAHHLEPRRDISRPHDRAGRRGGAAEDAERDRAEHPARGPHDHLPAGRRHAAAVRASTPARRRRSSC